MGLPRVLVVDDSPSTCRFIATVLQQVGYEVDTALDGREGLAKLATFLPHCLILDVLLPDTSGYALCRQLRQYAPTRRLPLILISSKNTPLDINYGLRQGADRYLPKPFTAEALVQKVWEVVPEPFHTAPHLAIPVSQKPEPPALSELIPRRVLNRDAMQTSNPFADTPVIKDRQARRLLDAIDGKRTVARLVTLMNLEPKEVARALRVLREAGSIEIYDSTGQRVEDAP
jgi:chemotaxis family two-component system response regulator PixH